MNRDFLLYFVLGAAGSDRRAVVADLVAAGLPAGARAAVLLSAAEKPDPADVALRAGGATVGTWHWRPPVIEAEVPEGTTHLFLIADGRSNPVDQVEALREWVLAGQLRLARVLFVANARLIHDRPGAAPWFEACAHYADVLLLTRTAGLEPRWIAAYEKLFRDRQHPFLFEIVRRGEVANPALVLDLQARRVAQVFDEETELADESEEEAAAARPENDRYFARTRGGTRVLELPDIAPFLEG